MSDEKFWDDLSVAELVERVRSEPGFGEQFWLEEVIKDIRNGKGFVRTRAATMLGIYLGLLGQKRERRTADRIEFSDEK